MKEKNNSLILLICCFGGILGLHYFYIGNIKKGCLYLFTGGLFCIGWIIDIVKIVNGNFEIIEDTSLTEDKIKDNKWKQICYNFYVSEEYQKLRINKQEINFSSIIDVDLIEDETNESRTTGNNITKGKSKKHIAPIKGLIGFGIAGPVGAIVGGTAGKTNLKSKTKVNTVTRSVNYCTNLSLKITLNDINNPMIIYKLIHGRVNKNMGIYKRAYLNAQKCVSMLQAIISNNTAQ